MANQPKPLDLGPYSVQWLETPPGPCAACGSPVGSGPVGFSVEEPAGPLCDICLLDRNPGLGMLLMMANVNRELAEQTVQAEESELADDRMVALMTVAQMYNQGSEWPVRSAGVLTYVSGLEERAIVHLLQMMAGSSN